MRLLSFFLSTFKGNYEDDREEIGIRDPLLQGSFLFHLQQQADEVIQVIVEVQE